MGRIEKTVFISHRRTNAAWALAIFQDLTHHGYDVFFDFNGIAGGDFERVILENISARAHFLVLLTPSALERCADPADWLRRETESALDTQRNIVPLMLENFDFGTPGVTGQLIGKLAALKRYHALHVPVDYFAAAMDRLRERCLNVPLDMVLHPVSITAQQAAKDQQAEASTAPPVPKTQLTAENGGKDTGAKETQVEFSRDVLDLEAWEGVWTDRAQGSWHYARVVDGQLLVPYCYGRNDRLIGHFYDLKVAGNMLRGRFEWLVPPRTEGLIAGVLVLSAPSADRLNGGWWWAKDLPRGIDPQRVSPATPKMNPLVLERVPNAPCASWAEEFFKKAVEGRLPSQETIPEDRF